MGEFELPSCAWLLPVLASATWVPVTIAVSDESICTGLCVVGGALSVTSGAAVVLGATSVVDGAGSVDVDCVVGGEVGSGSATAVDARPGSVSFGSVLFGGGAWTSSTTTVTVGAGAVVVVVVVAVSGAGPSSA